MLNPLETEGARVMASIFISYRREDSSGYTGRLHDRFIQRWGRQRVFMDIDNIDPGEDFLEVIDRTLAQTSAQAGLQDVAKFMYYPGTITPAIGLDLIVNAEKWDALPRDAQAALVRACDHIAQEMLEKNPAAQRRAFSALSEASVESARLPGPVVDALRSAWQKVAAGKSSNPTFRKLLESARPYASG